MPDREACERRVYRLATLLTGNPNAAVDVIASVVGAQPDLSRLDNSHMDRLTVLRSREIKPSTLVGEQLGHQVSSALASLTSQQREAWVFAHVYRMPLREAAKAMDCSVHAAEQHLRSSTEAMAARAGSASEAAAAAAALLAYSMSLDVPQFFRQQQHRIRVRRRVFFIVTMLILAACIALGVAWWRDRVLTPRPTPTDSVLPAQSSEHDAILGAADREDAIGADRSR